MEELSTLIRRELKGDSTLSARHVGRRHSRWLLPELTLQLSGCDFLVALRVIKQELVNDFQGLHYWKPIIIRVLIDLLLKL